MSDYHSTTGLLLPQSFVHVTALKMDDGETLIKCTCEIFDIIKVAGHQETPLWPEEQELVPDSSLTCLHCRFYRDHLLGMYEKLQTTSTNLNIIESTVKTSLEFMKNEVLILGNVLPQATTKFSVKGKQGYSVLNLSFPPNNCHVKCTNGMCSTNMKNSNKIPKQLPVQHIPYLCEHINTFTKNIQSVKSLFPKFFNTTQDSTVDESEIHFEPREELNLLDAQHIPELHGNFNKETGLWQY